MIEIKAITENEDDIGVTSSMEGRAIDLMAEGVALTESLINDSTSTESEQNFSSCLRQWSESRCASATARAVRTLLKSGIGFVLMMLGAMGGDGENLIVPIYMICIGAWMLIDKGDM